MSPEQFLQIANVFSDAALLLDETGGILAATPNVTELGLDSNTVIGNRLFDLSATPTEIVRDYLDACSHSTAPVLGWLVLVGEEGKQTLCRSHGTVFNGGDAEEEKQFLLRLIPRDVSRLSVTDVALRKDEFLAMLAHELRNPLAPIRSGLDLLAMDHVVNHDMVDLMKHQVDNLVRLVDDLLDMSHILHGKVHLRREPVKISDCFRRAVESVNVLVQNRQQHLVITVPSDPLWVHADPERLTQLVANLLTNACKFTGENGRIELFAERHGKQVHFGVRDNGLGIEREMLGKVFDLFTQASTALDRAEGGLGIGLTLVKSLVEMHGGTITVASEGTNRGSVFTVSLPLMEHVDTNQNAPESPPPEPRRRVLVVDDNIGAAKMLSLLLSRLGPYDVRTAHDGNATLSTIEEFRPEVVFLDIGLPGMNGYEVARRVRATFNDSPILLVAVTGYGQDEARQTSREAGFDVHLVKPVDTASLLDVFKHPKLPR